ncbi:MAG: sodium/glucose cotransporter, partial [Bacteroidales bacterium]|nr:sodium/glucose cotransporter [Bacteroidales bacterium]
ISLIDKKFISCELPEEKDRKTMMKWAKILGGAGAFFIIAALVVVIWGACLPATATPENNIIAYLNDIGFQAFIFFGVLVGCNAVWLWSDANDRKMDVKAVKLDLKLFHTSKEYAWGALAIGVITLIMYIALW